MGPLWRRTRRCRCGMPPLRCGLDGAGLRTVRWCWLRTMRKWSGRWRAGTRGVTSRAGCCRSVRAWHSCFRARVRSTPAWGRRCMSGKRCSGRRWTGAARNWSRCWGWTCARCCLQRRSSGSRPRRCWNRRSTRSRRSSWCRMRWRSGGRARASIPMRCWVTALESTWRRAWQACLAGRMRCGWWRRGAGCCRRRSRERCWPLRCRRHSCRR